MIESISKIEDEVEVETELGRERGKNRENLVQINLDETIEKNEKLIILEEDLKLGKQKFREKMYNIFQQEFEERITNILIVKETEFMNQFLTRIKLVIEDLYSNEAYESKFFVAVLKECEKKIYQDGYKKLFSILQKEWNEFERIRLRTNHSSKGGIDNKKVSLYLKPTANPHHIIYLKSFRKHCMMTEFAMHTCKGKFISVFDENNHLNQVICTGCKSSYFSNSILMYCSHCNKEYYSCHLANSNNSFQPATWEKYHCGALVNDQMRCIKCKNPFYIRLQDGFLVCLNKKCNFKINPSSVAWICMLCQKEFKTNAKIYNPMEYKILKLAIRDAILTKIPSKPVRVPCCKLNVDYYSFFHKPTCKGVLYDGEISGQKIVVCSTCKVINNFEKFIWTCPQCLNQFKSRNIEEEYFKIVDNNYLQYNTISIDENEGIYNNLKPQHTEENWREIFPSQPHNSENINISKRENERSENRERKNKNISFSLSKNNKKNEDDEEEEVEKIHKFRNKSKNVGPNTPSNISTKFGIKRAEIDLLKSDNNFNTIGNFSLEKENENKYSIKTPKSQHQTQTNFKKSNTVKSTEKEVFGDCNNCNNMNSNPLMNSFNRSNLGTSDRPNLYDVKASYKTEKGYLPLKNPFEIEEIRGKQPQKILDWNKYKQGKIEENLMKVEGKDDVNMRRENTKKDNIENFETTKNFSETETIGALKEFNIEDYNVVTQIGEGTFGKIYLVEDKNKNIFSMKKIIANDDIELETFQQEYELVNIVRHKNIMKILGICRRKLDLTTLVLHILMEVGINDWDKELKSRQSLKQYYSEKELLYIMKQLVSALCFLQKKNISHRDIKPQNVLLFKDNVYKVADFGEAKQISRLETNKQLSTLRGTELYMSPLLFNALRTNQSDIKHNSYKSDVFSLGFCVLYAATLNIQVLYECRNLYDSKSLTLLLHKSLRNNFSTGFINILTKMLDIDERNRYDFIELEDIIQELEE